MERLTETFYGYAVGEPPWTLADLIEHYGDGYNIAGSGERWLVRPPIVTGV